MTDPFVLELEERGARFLPSGAVVTMRDACTPAFRRQAFAWRREHPREARQFTLDIGAEVRG